MEVPFDEVAESVAARMDREQVRRCLQGLTALQREAVTLAYYGATPTARSRNIPRW
jgi:RNA polymerase sigma-70 factor (ECF subfamily)